MRYLITGGCGFLGTNLASEVIKRGEELYLFDNLSRKGSGINYQWLKQQGESTFFHGDIRLINDIERVIYDVSPDIIFHLAGQVAMTTSLENSRKDFETNVIGSYNLLESVRRYAPNAIVVYSSTNKVYGDLDGYIYTELPSRYTVHDLEHGFDETVGLDFRSPYGCSKGAADQYMLDYARNFGVKSTVFRHSSIFGGRQFSTFDQGWIGWFIQQALQRKNSLSNEHINICGNGKQVRDVLFASDLIRCYFRVVEHIDVCAGQAFNIGGGMLNSLSLLELFSLLESELDIQLSYRQEPWRKNDQKVFVADTRKAQQMFNWQPQVNKLEGVKKMISWVSENGE